MAFYFYLSTKIIMVFITKSYQDLFGVRSYINAKYIDNIDSWLAAHKYKQLTISSLVIIPQQQNSHINYKSCSFIPGNSSS